MLFAPTGTIINSCKSTLLLACEPPLIIFIIGTGMTLAFSPPRDLNKDTPASFAAALAAAIETANKALAPKRLLVSVPSNAIIFSSMAVCSDASIPTTASRNSPLTAATAFKTPLPK